MMLCRGAAITSMLLQLALAISAEQLQVMVLIPHMGNAGQRWSDFLLSD